MCRDTRFNALTGSLHRACVKLARLAKSPTGGRVSPPRARAAAWRAPASMRRLSISRSLPDVLTDVAPTGTLEAVERSSTDPVKRGRPVHLLRVVHVDRPKAGISTATDAARGSSVSRWLFLHPTGGARACFPGRALVCKLLVLYLHRESRRGSRSRPAGNGALRNPGAQERDV